RSMKLPGPRLHFLEEAHVLNRDGGLVGKGRYQLDLLVGEGSDFVPVQAEHAKKDLFPEHRDRQHSPKATNSPKLGYLILRIRRYIGNLNRAALHRSSTNRRPTSRGYRSSRKKFTELR